MGNCFVLQMRVPIAKDRHHKSGPDSGYMLLNRKCYKTRKSAEIVKKRAELKGMIKTGNHYTQVEDKIIIKQVPSYWLK
jgi:hypothetical protein